MQWWAALILGIVQGATEFLPVSSSGHLLLIEKFGIGEESLFFNVMLHVGTLVAVLIAMRKEWLPILKHPKQKLTGQLLIACIPTVIIAAVMKFAFPSLLNGQLLGFGFVLTSFLIVVSELFKPTEPRLLTTKTSILTGVLQGIAALPGVSRSGATISALTLSGVDRKEAASFSFLLSIPIILGSAALESVELIVKKTPVTIPVYCIVIGTLAAFLSGFLAISVFMKLIKNHKMTAFAIYTLILGIVVTLLPLRNL